MLAGGGITSKAGGLRGGGSLSTTALQPIISRCKVGCEQSIGVSCGNNGHKRMLNYEITTRHTHLLFRGGSLLLCFLGGSSFRSLPPHVSLLRRDNTGR